MFYFDKVANVTYIQGQTELTEVYKQNNSNFIPNNYIRFICSLC